MSTAGDVNKVKRNISNRFELRKVKLYALSLDYAGRIINDFRSLQPGGQLETGVWTNQTTNARNTMFSRAFKHDSEVGFFLSHFEHYGIYLELANDRKYEVIRPLIKKYARPFYKAARAIT
jgi:hypothetical protein